jgi:RluA family pseudouridine synthase
MFHRLGLPMASISNKVLPGSWSDPGSVKTPRWLTWETATYCWRRIPSHSRRKEPVGTPCSSMPTISPPWAVYVSLSMSIRKSSANRHRPKGIIILHEDGDILVVDKSSGLLTIGTERNKTKTVYYKLTDYIRKGRAKSRKRIFIVHRLDREASGILVFAKSKEAKLWLQGQWKETEKKYLAVVYGKLAYKTGTITSYLAENRAHVMYSTADTTIGKLARTAYKVLKETKELSLLEINLLTGRKNQIRVHLAEKGHPIVGDKKYGNGNKEYKRLALHAISISFKHPFSGKQVTFETKIPGYINQLVGSTQEEDSSTGAFQ